MTRFSCVSATPPPPAPSRKVHAQECAFPRRLAWAQLLRRVFGIGALACRPVRPRSNEGGTVLGAGSVGVLALAAART